MLHKKTLEYKQGMHEKQKVFEEHLKQQQLTRKPFNGKINQMSLQSATKFKQSLEPQGFFDTGSGGFDDIEAKMRVEAV